MTKFNHRWQETLEALGTDGIIREIHPGTQMSKSEFVAAMLKGNLDGIFLGPIR